jgi:hypothetical protein
VAVDLCAFKHLVHGNIHVAVSLKLQDAIHVTMDASRHGML